MLESLSYITKQTCCPLCGHKTLNKLDDSNKFSILKRGIGVKSEKVCKQVRDTWKQIKDGVQVYYV